MIKTCTCKDTFQDNTYGKGNRVHTETKKGDQHCTKCGPLPAWQQRLKSHANSYNPQIMESKK